MSDGRTHAAANALVIGATVIVSTQLPIPLAAGALAGSIAGFVVTPDIDLPGTTHEEYRMYRWLGFFGGGMWQMFWNHYARTHSHRGSSHRPFIGTAGRWWYVFIRMSPLIATVLYFHHSFVVSHAYECFQFVYMAFYLNVIQDLVHLTLDKWNFHKGH